MVYITKTANNVVNIVGFQDFGFPGAEVHIKKVTDGYGEEFIRAYCVFEISYVPDIELTARNMYSLRHSVMNYVRDSLNSLREG